MGVQGLWQLLGPVGQPVTLESLENKILAVDISIWLNQALKGFRDSRGGSVPNAHLLSLFSRICKLLYYKIRPIIVFDGGVPELKKQTVASRQIRRDLIKQNCRQAGLKILANYMASKALNVSKDKKTKNKNSPKSKDDDIYHLPPLPTSCDSDNDDIQDDCDEIEYANNHITSEEMKYLSNIDFESEDFEALPLDIKQEILATLKENRKHKSWEYYEALPDDSQDFAGYQMQCLLKRRRLQHKLEEVQKEMRQTTSAHILALYNDEEHIFGEPSKIMSDDQSHYVLIKKIVQGIKRKSGNFDSNNAKEAKTSNNALPNKQNLFTKVIENSLSGKQDVMLEEPLEILYESNNAIFKEVGNKSSDSLRSISKSKISDMSYTDKVKDFVERIPCSTEKRFDKNAVECKSSKECENNNFSVESNLNKYKIEKDSLLSVCDEVLSPEKVNGKGSIEYKDSSEIGLKDFSKKLEDVEIVQLNNSNDCLDNISKSVKSFEPNNNKNDSAHQQADNFDSFKLNTNNDQYFSQSNTEKSNVGTLSNRNDSNEDLDKAENECEATTGNKITVKNSFEEKAFPNSKNLVSSSDIFWEVNEMQISESCINTDTSEKEMVKSLSIVNESSVLSNYKPSSEISMPSCSSLDELATVSEYEVIACDENILETNAAIQNELMTESAVLEAEQAKQQRQASTIQEHTYQECQELLRLFGVPYIISPLEAEAQCAFFDSEDVTHGTITDDSDVWLFGGHKVYKNFFSHGKYVEFYRDTEIFSHFGLNRKKLINFAMLTGSDYTQGIEGVGPVTAMEILSEFGGEGIEVLHEFKEWWNSANKQPVSPKNKIRAKLQRLTINDGFPSSKVYEAYLNPKVDSSTESFTWGRPDLDALRDYTREKFGWNKNKADDALLPVMKRLNERTTQTHLDSFFTIHLKKEKNLFPSKRIMSALKKINSPLKKVPVEDESEVVEEKRKKAHSTNTTNKKTQRKKVIQRKKKIIKKKEPISKKIEIRTLQLSEESSSDN